LLIDKEKEENVCCKKSRESGLVEEVVELDGVVVKVNEVVI